MTSPANHDHPPGRWGAAVTLDPGPPWLRYACPSCEPLRFCPSCRWPMDAGACPRCDGRA